MRSSGSTKRTAALTTAALLLATLTLAATAWGQAGGPTPAKAPASAPAPTPAGTPAPAQSPAGAPAKAPASAPANPAAQQAAALEAAIQQLVAEARELDEFEQPKMPPVYTRPHPKLRGLNPEAVSAMLQRMTGSFTGNAYRDTYIRWHLMAVVQKIEQVKLRDDGPRLVSLVKQMPPALRVEHKQEWQWNDADLARKVEALTPRVTVGYPPFDQYYRGEAAIPHLPAAQQAAARANLAQANELRKGLKQIVNPGARTFNTRVRQVNWIVRQYRGELIYQLLRTGDPTMLKLVVEEIGKQIGAQQRIALDLMSFLYLAAFDGLLDHYSAADRAAAADQLERLARPHDLYRIYGEGDWKPSERIPRNWRNIADYAFHLINLLRDSEGVATDASS
jgi:hypothetical protein